MTPFASVDDVNKLFKTLNNSEKQRVSSLLPLISDTLRTEAVRVGKDLDKMIEADETGAYRSTVKIVTVDIIGRILRQDTESEPMSQESQSALGYTWSGTYAIPGGGINSAIMRNDLKRLGLRAQSIGVIDLA